MSIITIFNENKIFAVHCLLTCWQTMTTDRQTDRQTHKDDR